MRVEISLGFVVSLRPKGAAFGQAGSTRLDLRPQMVGLFSDNKKYTRTDFGCGTSFAKRCSGMVRAKVDVVRQEHSAGFTPQIFQSCYHPVLQPVTEHYTQGTCEGTTLKCEKCCVA